MEIELKNDLIQAVFRISIVLITGCCLPNLVFGQELRQEEGELEDTEVIIEKKLNIELPIATRKFKKIEEGRRKDEVRKQLYSPKEFSYKPSLEKVEIKAQDFPDDTTKVLNQNYLSLGYGNYNAPFVEALFSFEDKAKRNYKAFYQHDSYGTGPIEDEKSAEGMNRVNLQADIPLKSSNIHSEIDVDRRVNRFYGSDGFEIGPSDSIKQVYSFYGFALGLANKNWQKKKVYDLDFGLKYYDDNLDLTEFESILSGQLEASINEGLVFNLGTLLSLSSYANSSDKFNRNYFLISPTLVYAKSNITLRGGVNLSVQNDSIFEREAVVLPDVSFNYNINSKFGVEVGIEGNVDQKTYGSYKKENGFLADSHPWHVKRLSYFLSLRGAISDFGFSLGGRYNDYDFLPIFSNNPTDVAKFVLTPLKGVQEINFNATVDRSFSNGLISGLVLNLFKYEVDGGQDVLHRPTLRADFFAEYKLFEQLLLRSSIGVQSGRKARLTNGDIKTLSVLSDFRLSADYQIDTRVKLFTQVNNILGSKREYFHLYPARGLSARVGFSYLF